MTTIHHIEGYDASNPWPEKQLIILCKEHHDLADFMLRDVKSPEGISKEELYRLKARPFNIERVSGAFQVPSEKELVVKMAGVTMIECQVALEIHGEPN